ncbi:MAG: SH3 domain-containing protein [Anaerolineales bacterium]
MTPLIARASIFSAIVIMGLGVILLPSATGIAHAQQPTVAVPTVTGTPIGPYIVVNTDNEGGINVRTGPGTEYPAVGILVPGELAPAKGRSAGGLWIQVVYVGVDGGLAWVYAPLVTLFPTNASLTIVEPPPTPTPRVTPTIDPTLAAQFVLEIPATRLPTFTPVEPLEIPEFEQGGTGRVGGIPVGMFITAIGLAGLFAAGVAYLRER